MQKTDVIKPFRLTAPITALDGTYNSSAVRFLQIL